MTLTLQFFLVFLTLAVVDACWTVYVKSINEEKPAAAAAWSSVIVVLGAYAVVSYVHKPVLVIAAALGAYVGTYLTVKLKKNTSRIID